MQLTVRDRTILRLVYRNRFLRSSQIVALVGGGPQQLLRRLQLLYHHGYLERPRAQIDYYHQGGSRRIVYGLGNKGGSILKQELGIAFHELRSGEKNRSVGRLFLEHALLVSDIMVALELSCRKAGNVRLLTAHNLPLSNGAPQPHPFKWNVEVNDQTKLGIIPDRVFALEFDDEAANQSRVFFFLEADRGTMPVMRRNLAQTSFYRKILAYEATWAQGLHRSQFDFNRLRVLTVTKSAARVKSLVDVCSQLRKGHRLFLFGDQASLEKHGDILTFIWKTGLDGETATLLN